MMQDSLSEFHRHTLHVFGWIVLGLFGFMAWCGVAAGVAHATKRPWLAPLLVLVPFLIAAVFMVSACSATPTARPPSAASQLCADYRTMIDLEAARCDLPPPTFEGPTCSDVVLFGASLDTCHDVLHAMTCADLAKLALGAAASFDLPAVCFYRADDVPTCLDRCYGACLPNAHDDVAARDCVWVCNETCALQVSE